ncbi:MAG TPA: hypothetical protein VEY91_09590 [Candidatus Limnocylindria bacterium]|nr:hypothetical protein [Candidatus Limnocylindria bacterium]
MRRRTALSALWLAALVPAAPALAGPWGLQPGEWFSEFRSGVFTADSWHNDDGDRGPLFDGGVVEDRTLVAYNELGWRKRTSFLLAVPAKSITRRASTRPFERTETGLGDMRVGFRHHLANGPTALALELEWKAPMGYDRHFRATHQDSIRCGEATGNGDSLNVDCLRQSVSPRLGEGQQDVSLMLQLGTSLPALRGYAHAGGGYRYRFDAPADQIVGNAELGVWVTRSLLLAGHYEGELAIGDGNLPVDEVNRHRAGPRIVYRLDDQVDLIVSSLHTALARNAFHTDQVFVGIAFKQSSLNRFQGALGTLREP